MSKVYLCSFASPDLNLSKNRFIKQSKSLNFYEEIKIFGWDDLDKEKQAQIKNFFIKKQKRLFGYASWKPDIILAYLDVIPENSILQYSDIGCEINVNGLKRLKDYVKITDEKKILAFKYSEPNFNNKVNFKFQVYFENEYTKADARMYFDIDEDSNILKTEQIWSGSIFFKNNSYVRAILNQWKKACSISNLIDDSESEKKNHKDFIEHRHDQSIFSLIGKKENIFCLSASECEWAQLNGKRIWSHLDCYPILAKRDKKKNIFSRFIDRQKINIKKRLNRIKINF